MEPTVPSGKAATIPCELNGPVPRKVRSSPAGVRSALLAAVVVAVAFAGTSWVALRGVHEFQNRAALRTDGIDATGQITALSHGRRSGYQAYYSFTVNGLPVAGKAPVPRRLEHTLSESSHLSIRYLPADPAVNQPVDWEEPISGAVVLLMFPLFPIAVGIMMLASGHKERRLLAEGLPAIATITKSYTLSKGGHYANYEFRTKDGDIEIGNCPSDESQPVGSTFCVIYLPQNPRQNLPYPLNDYSVVVS